MTVFVGPEHDLPKLVNVGVTSTVAATGGSPGLAAVKIGKLLLEMRTSPCRCHGKKPEKMFIEI